MTNENKQTSSREISNPFPSEFELLDIVDHNNEVIGQSNRKDIHNRGLRHRSAHLLIFNTSGDLFLQKRSKHKDDFPNCWDSSAAGHVDAGESYEQCIVREAREELGITLEKMPEKQFLLEASKDNGMEFCQVFTTVHNGPFQLDPYEVDTGEWFSPPRISQWLMTGSAGMTPSIQVMINKLRSLQNKDS